MPALLLVAVFMLFALRGRGPAPRGASPSPSPGSSPITSSSRVALIGDSLGVGLGPELAKIAKSANVPFQFEAHSGTRVRQWVSHAAACGTCGDWLAAFRPTHVFVVLGTNDMGLSSPATTEGPFYAQLRDKLRALGAKVIWVEPPNMPTQPHIARVRPVIERLNVDVFHTENAPVLVSSDGVHPGGAAYATWANLLWAYATGR